VFVCVGISHKQAPIQVREQLSVAADQLPERLRQLQQLPGVKEAMLLSTCNRLVVWAAAEGPGAAEDIVESLGPLAAPHAVLRHGDEALRHLFRVAASLDSMVVGEAQILGQVKEAAAAAQSAGVCGAQLGRALARATSAAKRVRTETAIARGAVSLSSVAVELAAKVLGDLRGRVVLLLGAGEMAQLAARELKSAGASELLVANRSLERAEELVREVGGVAVSLGELPALLERADVVLCSTGAREPVVTREQMARVVKARRFRPAFFIDLALPRNIEPSVNELENVYVYDLDDLEQVAARNRDLRAAEVEHAEQIVEQELKALLGELRERTAVPVLARLRGKAQEIADAEAEKLLAQLGPLSEKQEKSVRAMASAIVNKLLHGPTARLREEGREGGRGSGRDGGREGGVPPSRSLADAAVELFDLGDGPQASAGKAAGNGEAVEKPAATSGQGAAARATQDEPAVRAAHTEGAAPPGTPPREGR
jgi:glutamyl-tRNA reductase